MDNKDKIEILKMKVKLLEKDIHDTKFIVDCLKGNLSILEMQDMK